MFLCDVFFSFRLLSRTRMMMLLWPNLLWPGLILLWCVLLIFCNHSGKVSPGPPKAHTAVVYSSLCGMKRPFHSRVVLSTTVCRYYPFTPLKLGKKDRVEQGVLSEARFLDSRTNPGTCKYVRCGREVVLIRREQVADSKIYRYVWTGPKINRQCALLNGCRDGVVMRALASHQCGPGSISRHGVICGLSLLVLYSAPRGFSPGTPVFPSL